MPAGHDLAAPASGAVREIAMDEGMIDEPLLAKILPPSPGSLDDDGYENPKIHLMTKCSLKWKWSNILNRMTCSCVKGMLTRPSMMKK